MRLISRKREPSLIKLFSASHWFIKDDVTPHTLQITLLLLGTVDNALAQLNAWLFHELICLTGHVSTELDFVLSAAGG